jgi:hypothetical protein
MRRAACRILGAIRSPSLADIFQEVEEDLRADRYKRLWEKYGKFVVGAAVAVVLATAGTVAWKDWQQRQRAGDSARLAGAMAEAQKGERDAALAQLAMIARDGTAGYAMLARLQEAAVLADKGDPDGAAAIYDKVAADASLDAEFRDLARLLAVLQRIDKDTPASLMAALEPLLAAGPWRPIASELAALVALRQGDKAKAREFLTRVADDAQAPRGARACAAELLGGLDR